MTATLPDARFLNDTLERSALALALMGDGNGIVPAHFRDKRRRLVAEQMIVLRASGRPLDIVTLSEALQQSGHVLETDWPLFLGELLNAPASKEAAGLLADHARLSSLDDLASRIHERTREPGGHPDPRTTIAEIEDMIWESQRNVVLRRRKLNVLRLSDYDLGEAVPLLFGNAEGESLLAAGDLALIVGEVGSGKTLVLIDAAIAVATGQPLLSFPALSAAKAMLVLADGDGDKPVKRRIARLAAGRGIDLAQLDAGNLRVFTPDGFILDASHDFLELVREVEGFDPDLLCIESLSSLMGPDRDSWNQTDVADFAATRLRPLQLRRDGSRRTMIVGHHLTKKPKEKGAGRLKDRAAGSYYVLGAADAAVSLEPGGAESALVRPLKRSRWGVTFRPFLAVYTGQGREPLRLTYSKPLSESEDERSESETALIHDLSAITTSTGYVSLADVKARRNIGRNSKEARAIERTAARLLKRGDLQRGPDKGSFRIVKGGMTTGDDTCA